MISQFLTKLAPFASWIRAGNVIEQARESGLGFEVDVIQSGFNTVQPYVGFAANITIGPPNSSGFSGSMQNNTRTTQYLRLQRVDFNSLTVQLLTPISFTAIVKLTTLSPYALQFPNSPAFGSYVLARQTLRLDGTVTLANFSAFSSINIPFDLVIPPTSELTAEIFLSRSLAVSEELEWDIEWFATQAEVPGMQILK